MELERVDTDVTNLTDGAGVVDSQLIKTDEPIEVIVGHFLSGVPVSGDVQYFAAVDFNRQLDEDEQAMYGENELDFSTLLVAGEDGTAEDEAVVNVSGGDVAAALDALEDVVTDYEVDITESSRRQFAVEASSDEDSSNDDSADESSKVEDGELVENAVAETDEIEEGE